MSIRPVRRIVQSQGVPVGDEPGEEEVDPNQTTNVMRRAELDEDGADPDASETIEGDRDD